MDVNIDYIVLQLNFFFEETLRLGDFLHYFNHHAPVFTPSSVRDWWQSSQRNHWSGSAGSVPSICTGIQRSHPPTEASVLHQKILISLKSS